ncbi:uncharacterized protein LOC108740483 isoform X2 [Agrilus planipennis]|uniref:Uncharacterized protein LOC108740483 isoform X2 n=1 Tax=Agrilus planipennis TaxID=224129 RepID=A0A7F5RN49_AGRPL|nr:uncharacterized protein LOC112906731 isoform X2 [Agrilus planipennis]XP_025837257.1 uncharacterized protein LOC108740483 isoform X2 [Agrilus planipennis]
MAIVKHTVAVLCKHLNFLYDLELKSETFRQAKFNKCEEKSIEQFWNVLSALGNCEFDNETNKIKDFLNKLGYTRSKFYDLDLNTTNARELLFALAFIISKGELDRIVKKKCQKSLFHIDSTLRDSKNDINFSLNALKDENDLANSIEWIKGKANYNKTVAKEYELSINNVLEKLRALNDMEYARLFLNNTKEIIQMLDNHDQWLKKEAAFWEWMNTVIIEDQKGNNSLRP